jgi:hypothetical protein
MSVTKTIAQIECFRFVERGILEINGKPDLRLQMQDDYTLRWRDVYNFDNEQQCLTAIEDIEYAKWLCDMPCYIKDEEEEG